MVKEPETQYKNLAAKPHQYENVAAKPHQYENVAAKPRQYENSAAEPCQYENLAVEPHQYENTPIRRLRVAAMHGILRPTNITSSIDTKRLESFNKAVETAIDGKIGA